MCVCVCMCVCMCVCVNNLKQAEDWFVYVCGLLEKEKWRCVRVKKLLQQVEGWILFVFMCACNNRGRPKIGVWGACVFVCVFV